MDRQKDAWANGIYYDTAFERVIAPSAALALDSRAERVSGIGLIARTTGSADAASLWLAVIGPDGVESGCWTTAAPTDPGARPTVAECRLNEQVSASRIRIENRSELPVVLSAVSLIGPSAELSQVVDLSSDFRLAHLSDVKIYDVALSASRVWLPREVSIVDSEEAVLDTMRGESFDGRRQVVVRSSDWDREWPTAFSGQADARVLTYEPERVQVMVKSDATRLLVVMDSWYPGWEADVNGSTVRLVRVDHSFRGVIVPAGESTVTLSYRPTSLLLGAAISVATILGVLALLLVHWARQSPMLE